MHRPAEVSDLQLSLEPQEQILRLYISVDDLPPVAVEQRIRQLLHDLQAQDPAVRSPLHPAWPSFRLPMVPWVPTRPDRGCPLLIEGPALLQLLVELPARGVLQNQVDPPPVIEVVVEPQDVGVPGGRDRGCLREGRPQDPMGSEVGRCWGS